MVNSLARSGNTHTERHLSLGGGKFCNESESLNLQESSADISMGNQCRINIIRVPRWFKAVMQEDEIFRMNERDPYPKLKEEIIPSSDNEMCVEKEIEEKRLKKKNNKLELRLK